jgi:Na+-transporting methylmalonyl-CoA/oxaloacetate decarboxylase gamma subunit
MMFLAILITVAFVTTVMAQTESAIDKPAAATDKPEGKVVEKAKKSRREEVLRRLRLHDERRRQKSSR